jgi:ChAPs (Chs5p-Arf1p-binding proteins)
VSLLETGNGSTPNFASDEEVKAVQIMGTAMKETPQSYLLLHTQCDFLRSKGKHDWALKLARQAVNCAPSEFVTWEKLTDIYIDLREYESVRFSVGAFYCCQVTKIYTGVAHSQLVSNVHIQRARRTPQPHRLAITFTR